MTKTKQGISLLLILMLSMLMACATPAANEIKLNMQWKDGQPTKHAISFQLGLEMQLDDENEQKRDLDKNTTYEGTYVRQISKHEQGLLVSFSDVEVTSDNPGMSDIRPSTMQLAIAKMTALLIVARPDFIMSPDGDFIALHDYDQYVADTRSLLSDLIGGPNLDDSAKNSFGGIFSGVMDAGLKQALLEEQIQHDLALVKDIDQISLQLGKPLKTMITPAYTSKHTRNDKEGVKIAGTLSYNGDAKCKWKTTTTCADIRFSMDDEKTYDVKMVIEPETLTLHDFVATTDVTLEQEYRGSLVKAKILSGFVHSVELQ